MTTLNAEQVAEMLGISRRTVYRWADIGRIPPAWCWRHDTLVPFVGLGRRPKGPPRRRSSLRYTVYRHRFDRA
jgi:helix-turn-helix protein